MTHEIPHSTTVPRTRAPIDTLMNIARTGPIGNIVSSLVDFIFPHLCPMCQIETSTAHVFCGQCWGDIQLCDHLSCRQCGLHIPENQDGMTCCANCQTLSVSFTQMRAVAKYQSGIRSAILRLKHADQLSLVPIFARMMLNRIDDWLPDSMTIIPVPLHPKRLRHRLYNQSALVAQNMGMIAEMPILLDGLLRIKNTAMQGKFNRKQRKNNVKNCFRVPDHHRETISGKCCLLVDDVFTTGATVDACAKALLDADAKDVRVITIAVVGE